MAEEPADSPTRLAVFRSRAEASGGAVWTREKRLYQPFRNDDGRRSDSVPVAPGTAAANFAHLRTSTACRACR
ncbi:MAG TPA: hypothetical protein PKM33_13095, partial [Mycobacterium sp.]|nr:hypothetical protein [Mycobacterium sp.]